MIYSKKDLQVQNPFSLSRSQTLLYTVVKLYRTNVGGRERRKQVVEEISTVNEFPEDKSTFYISIHSTST